MSVMLGAGGKVLLGPGGKVADNADCCCGGGACCNGSTCTPGMSRADCESGGGTYLGDGSTCDSVDCTCCPIMAQFSTIAFSGQVLGCSSGTVAMPQLTWSKVPGTPGCNLDPQEFATDTNCFCQFQAHNCFPGVEVDYVAIDETGGCADPFSFGSNYLFTAEISCDGMVAFNGTASPISPAPACAFATGSNYGPYDFTGGSLDVTVSAQAGDTSISFRFILSFS